MALASWRALNNEQKKFFVCSGVIALCLVGAAAAYWQLSDSTPKETPQVKAAEDKAAQIQAGMEAEQKKQPQPPPPPPPPPGVHRGSVAPPK